MSGARILISGASIAGPALAFWLVKAGCRVTVVERSQTLRKDGQGVDIRDTARDVIRKMGLFQTIRDRSSHEEGTRFVNSKNECYGSFEVDLSGDGNSMTSDVEILRGELANILYDATKEKVTYRFGETVESLQDGEDEVVVSFSSGKSESFDLVVAADGLGSKIRTMAFGQSATTIRSLHSYVSYFSIEPNETDTKWARVSWQPSGRVMALRPDNVGRIRAFLMTTAYDAKDERLKRYSDAMKSGREAQKQVTQELFQDTGLDVKRLLKGMHQSKDFYMQHVAQVKLTHWSAGRVTVVGDAGYAPSPFTGMGTSLAFIGAYILAGEVSESLHDLPAAVRSYERIMKPYVEKTQSLAPGIPWIVNPQSSTGVRILEGCIAVVSYLTKTRIVDYLGKLFSKYSTSTGFKLPEYEAFTR